MEKPEEKVLLLATLVFPVRDGEVLLARKMRKIGQGFLNGWGGGVESGESIITSAVREFNEETGGAEVEEKDLEKVGVVHFKNNKADGTVFICVVHVFVVRNWTGNIVSTSEMDSPQWYSIKSLPEQELMLADRFWLPRMLKGETGIVHAEYGPYQKTLIGKVLFHPESGLTEEG